MSLVSVVVPVYHNAASLEDLYDRLAKVADEAPESFEFIFVDDGSKDDSFAVVQRLCERDERVRGVKLVRNFGSEAAAAAGFAHARGDAVVAISADLQDPPELILEMLAHWREGRKIVLAARSGRDDPFFVRVTSAAFWRLFRKLAVPTMPPGGCDFLLVDRVVVEQLADFQEPGSGVAKLLWTGYEPALVPYQRRRRPAKYGASRWSWSKRIVRMVDMFVAFTDFPVRAASLLGIALAGVGGVYAFLLILERLTSPDYPAPRGWAVSMVVYLLVSGVQLVMIGVLGEYLLRAIAAVRRRPPYLIERVAGGKKAPADGPSAAGGAERLDSGA